MDLHPSQISVTQLAHVRTMSGSLIEAGHRRETDETVIRITGFPPL